MSWEPDGGEKLFPPPLTAISLATHVYPAKLRGALPCPPALVAFDPRLNPLSASGEQYIPGGLVLSQFSSGVAVEATFPPSMHGFPSTLTTAGGWIGQS